MVSVNMDRAAQEMVACTVEVCGITVSALDLLKVIVDLSEQGQPFVPNAAGNVVLKPLLDKLVELGAISNERPTP